MAKRKKKRKPLTKVGLSQETLRQLHDVKHYTLQQIADHLGVTRQAIHYQLNVKLQNVKCATCGNALEVRRRVGRTPKEFYFCPGCKPKKAIWQTLAEELLE